MKRFRDLKIGLKLTVLMTLLVITIIAITSTIIGFQIKRLVENNAKTIAQETANHYASRIQIELELALDETRALAKILASLTNRNNLGLTRRKIDLIMKDFLEQSDIFTGINLAFEPNAFDGKDINFSNEWGYDETGRFAHYWSKNRQGRVKVEKLQNYDTGGAEDFYRLTRKHFIEGGKKEAVIDPYLYKVQGKDILVTTLSASILDEHQRFIGMVGIDISFEHLRENVIKKELSQVSHFKYQYSTFFSANGTLIDGGDEFHVTNKDKKNIAEVTDDQMLIKNLQQVARGESFYTHRQANIGGKKERVVTWGVPIKIGHTDIYWGVTINIFESELTAVAQQMVMFIISIGVGAILIAMLIVYFLAKTLSMPLNNVIEIFDSISVGNLNNKIDQGRQDEIGQLFDALARMQTQLRKRIEEDRRIANEALRINEALDNVGTSVLIANTQYQVIYANNAAQQLFKERRAEIHQDLPKLDVDHLVGCPIDAFHKNPEKIRQLINHLTTTHYTLLEVDNLNVDMHITPVINAEGQRLGWVAEFNDRTAEVTIEQEVNTVMSAAAQGDFSQRLQLDGKTGFFKVLSEVLNQTLNYNQQMISELMHVFSAIARGDLSQTITKDYSGSLAQLKDDVNATISKLTAVITAIQAVADAASQGDFSQRIELSDNIGFFKTLSDSLNHMLVLNQQIIEELMRVFGAVVQGDLTQEITKNYTGSLEQVKSDVNTTLSKLTSVINIIQQTVDAVNVAAGEISRGNLNLSQRTEEQAASLEQTAASMEQMTGTVQQNTDHTRQAATLATNACEQAVQGGKVVNNVVVAIDKINKSSKQVADIISVIDDIAFQTNLLALNAAVEAARAGEQGRGFAVVATEVRNLAQRSAEAAKEIKALIQDSVDRVGEGTQLVSQSGHVLEDIVTAVKKVSDIISEIASASQEQTSGIHQVNKAVAQMEEMTQQNAALVEESAAASESMKKQAEHLKNHIAFFKTDKIR